MGSSDLGHVVLTGGVGAIGAATAQRLLTLGYRVTILDVAKNGDIEDSLERLGHAGQVAYIGADVRDRGSVDDALASAFPFDVVIGIAGIGQTARFVNVTADEWQRHLDINLTGNFNVAQSAVRLLLGHSRPGRLIFVSSWVGERAWPESSAYAVSKAGLNMLARCIALETARQGITVNVVAPGILNAGLSNEEALRNPDYATRIKKAIPLGRLQTVEDVANVLTFMSSPEARP